MYLVLVRVGIDLVHIPRLNDTNSRAASISNVLYEVLNINISKDPVQLAKWIAVNEAVYKSLEHRFQVEFRGCALIKNKSGGLDLDTDSPMTLINQYSKSQVSVSQNGEWVIAIAISKLKIQGLLKNSYLVIKNQLLNWVLAKNDSSMPK
jgi:phosphopantetheinyl transferase (holo-ACP synthase)